MRGAWRDPDDVTPNAQRAPKTVAGWRTFDPLRRMAGHPNSGITVEHIMAADMLRERVDLATLGYSAVRPLIYVVQYPLPRWGLGPAAMAQVQAARAVRRVMRAFNDAQLRMLEVIVLGNVTLRAWTLRRNPPSTLGAEKRKLLVVLDRLAEHFASEVREDVAKGRRLVP